MSDVERTRESLSDLSRMMDTVEQQSLSLAKRFGDMSDESKKWTFVSRILSGTGLWRLQNRIRAVGNAMKFYKDAQLDKIKSDIEEAEGMAKLQEALKSKEMQQDVLKKLAEDTEYEPKKDEEEYENKMKIVNQYRLLAATIEQTTHSENAHEIALARTKKAYDTVGEAITDLQEKRIKKYQKALDKQDKREHILAQRKIIREGKNAKALLKQEQKKLKEHVKEKEKQTGKLAEIERQIKNNEFATYKHRSKLRAERIKTIFKLKRLGGLEEATKETISEKEEFISKGGEAKDRLKELTGLKATLEAVGEKITKPLAFVKDKVMSGTEEYRKNVKEAVGLRNKMSEAFSPITKVMKFAARNLMFFTLLLMGAFLVFSIIRKIFENAEVMNTVMEVIKGVLEGVAVVFSALHDIFMAFFGTGTFGERLQLLLKGILKMWAGLGKILMTIVGAVFKLLGGLLFGIIEFVFVNIPQMLYSALHWVVKLISTWAAEKLENTKNWFVEKWEGFKTWITNSAIWKAIIWVKNKFKAGINKIITGLNYIPGVDIQKLATGGITKGGLTLVGEQGPELLHLPRGGIVHSNADSRKMMGNTINVNVSGRVGASDSELRDIAKKIGRMVSAEINRTTSSSTNVRF